MPLSFAEASLTPVKLILGDLRGANLLQFGRMDPQCLLLTYREPCNCR
jgi:hypothetical protein